MFTTHQEVSVILYVYTGNTERANTEINKTAEWKCAPLHKCTSIVSIHGIKHLVSVCKLMLMCT